MKNTFLPGSIIYGEDYGFGIICENNKSDAVVKAICFCNTDGIETVKNVPVSEIVAPDAVLLDYVRAGKYCSEFSNRTLSNGRNYLQNGKIEEISYDAKNHAVSAVVEGSRYEDYFLTIQVKKTAASSAVKLYTSCSCPVEKNCKHAAGVFENLSEFIKTLEGYYRNYQENLSLGLDFELQNIIDELSDSSWISLTAAKDLVKVLEKNDDPASNTKNLSALTRLALARIYPAMKGQQGKKAFENLVSYMLADEKFYNMYDSLIHNTSVPGGMHKALCEAYERVSYLRHRDADFAGFDGLAQIELFYDDKYAECLRAYMKMMRRCRDYDIGINVPSHIDEFVPDKELQEEIFDFCTENIERISDHSFLFDFIGDEQKRNIYLNPKYKGEIPESVLLTLDAETFLKLNKDKELSPQALAYVEKNIAECIAADSKAVARILEKEYFRYPNRVECRKIKKCAAMLPHSQYLQMYLENAPANLYSYPNQRCQFSFSTATVSRVNEEDLFEYFTPAWDFSCDNNVYKYSVGYILLSPGGKKVVLCRKYSNSLVHTEANYIDLKNGGPLVDFVISYTQAKYKNEIDKKIAGYTKEFQDNQNRILWEDFRKRALALADRKKREIVGSAGGFSLELYFRSHVSIYNSETCELELKVGDAKKYVVQDIRSFLSKFKKCETSALGKKLTLTHNIANFTDTSKAVIKTLLAVYDSSRYSQKRAIDLSKRTCKTLLSQSRGTLVYIDNNPLLISEEDVPVRARINPDHTLGIVDDKGNAVPSLMDFDDAMLAINKEEKKAFFISASDEELELIRFANSYTGMDISPVADIVSSLIMPYFRRSIDIADSIKDEFPMSHIKIGAFFDYNDKELSLKEQIKRGEKQIRRSELKSNEDLIHYERYAALIEGMGFENGLLKDETGILNFFRMDFTELKQYCDVMLSDSILSKRVMSFGKQTVKVKHEGSIMQAFLAESEFSDEELELIYKALKRKKSYALLSDNRIIALDNDLAADFKNTIEDLQLDPKHLHREKKLSLVQSLRALSHQSSCEIDEYLENMISDIKSFKSFDMRLPSISGSFRQYQIEAVKWLRILSDYGVNGILADDMGLGKTIEIIGLICSDATKMPSLILCPKSLIFNWKNEFSKFAPAEKVIEIYGSADERQSVISAIKKNEKVIYISSYDSLRNDIEHYGKTEFSYIIADEAQNIKNTETQKSKNAKQLKALHRFALTGTPIENSITDLWSIFDFTMPGYFSDLNTFVAEYSAPGGGNEKLAKQIAPFLLRRTKELVLNDLPDKYERVITAEMSKPQRMVYDAYVNKAKSMLDAGSKAFDMLPYITRLRQICVDPGMFVENFDGRSGKMDKLCEIIDEYIPDGHRILIFSQFVKALESVEKVLEARGLDYFLLTGDTAADKRIEYADKFNRGIGPKLFLISLKAGGTGLNLTGADTVIHLDPWWNVAAENQATDRAHRIGQTKNVEVIKLICENSIEQRVVELQNIKKDIIDKVITKDDTSVTSASLQDIAFILE